MAACSDAVKYKNINKSQKVKSKYEGEKHTLSYAESGGGQGSKGARNNQGGQKKKKITERKISRIDESLCGEFYCKMKNKNEKHFQIPLTYKNNVIK